MSDIILQEGLIWQRSQTDMWITRAVADWITNKFREDLEPIAGASQTRHVVKPTTDTGSDL